MTSELATCSALHMSSSSTLRAFRRGTGTSSGDPLCSCNVLTSPSSPSSPFSLLAAGPRRLIGRSYVHSLPKLAQGRHTSGSLLAAHLIPPLWHRSQARVIRRRLSVSDGVSVGVLLLEEEDTGARDAMLRERGSLQRVVARGVG